MKILIIGFAKIKYMPYINFYLESISRVTNELHVLYWNRDLKEEDLSALDGITLHEFKCYQENDVSRVTKIKSFFKYRKFAKSVINEGNFDFIIFLHSLPGVIVSDILLKKFRNRTIFDYRDSTYEAFAPFKKRVGKLVEASSATFVSSDAFRRFLPEDQSFKIHTSHNILLEDLSHRDTKEMLAKPSDKIRISYWGFIRHEEINKEMIKKISQDDRFELHYYGREQKIALDLKQYALDINSKNVFFHGEYVPSDRYEFVKCADIIHNVYHDENMLLAVSNKYYDGIVFRIPQICFKGSFMGDLVECSGIGYSCDPYDADFTQKVYDYYTNIDDNAFKEATDDECERIIDEFHKAECIVNRIFEHEYK